jgi:predicted nucleotidyltransferase
MCNKTELDGVTNIFAKQAKSVFGDSLCDVILFDSYARGDYDEESDIDIILVADMDPMEAKKILTQFAMYAQKST